MYKLLVVDDKLDSIRAIKKLIDWENEGITTFISASNGSDGLRMFQRHMPDIIITDIKMPQMDGLAMLEEVKKIKPSTQVIILSGYDEFSFAQKAVKYGAREYLLKPVSTEEIKQAVVRAKETIALMRKKAKEEIGLKEQLQDILAIRKKEYLNNLIHTRVKNIQEMDKRFKELKITIANEYISCAIVRIDNYSTLEAEKSIDDMEVIRYLIMNIVKEVLAGYACEIFVCSDREFCLLINYDMLEGTFFTSMLEEKLQICRNKINQMLKFTVTISIGRSIEHPDEIVDAYQSAKEALKYRMVLGKNQVISYNRINSVEQEAALVCSELLKKIIISLQSASDELTVLLQQWGDKLKEVYDIFEVKRLIFQLIGNINSTAHYYSVHNEHIVTMMNHIKMRSERYADIDELIGLILKCVNEVVQCIRSHPQEKSRKEVDKAIQYIQQQFHQHITLNGVAAYVKLSPTYLSYLLKHNTGKTFTELVVECRIEEAKKLLISNCFKVYEVAEKVGYTDRRYFSEMFKKYTNMNPTAYINNYARIK